MAVTVRNIMVGAGNLWIAPIGTALPTPTAGTKMSDALDASAAVTAGWRSVGATQEGLEIAYEPDYGEVEVDQLKDAAVLFNQGVSVSLNTNLAEATLENLMLAWGLAAAQHTGGGTGVDEVLNLGVPDEEPVERVAAVVGRAPAGNAGAEPRERVYYARRVMSVEASSHSLRRTEATVFPVSFRLLPDPGTNNANKGSEYGRVIDRVIGEAP